MKPITDYINTPPPKGSSAVWWVLSAFVLVMFAAAAAIPTEFDRSGEQMQITIYYAKDKHQLTHMVNKVKNFQIEENQSGIAFYSPNDNICQVFVIRPKRDAAYEMAPLGHEVFHCTNGKFH